MIEPIEGWVSGTGVAVLEDDLLLLPLTDDEHALIRVVPDGAGVVTLVAQWSAPSMLTGPQPPVTMDRLAEAAASPRSGLLHCVPEPAGATIRMTVYLDGLRRHGFLDAMGEVGRAYRFMSSAAAELESTLGVFEEARRQGAVAAASEPAARPSAPAPPPAAPAGVGWVPSHVVVPGGVDARVAPDPALAVAVHLPPGMEVVVRDWRGGWAQVVASNGWTGWVAATGVTPKA